jgi:hypothetical protein
MSPGEWARGLTWRLFPDLADGEAVETEYRVDADLEVDVLDDADELEADFEEVVGARYETDLVNWGLGLLLLVPTFESSAFLGRPTVGGGFIVRRKCGSTRGDDDGDTSGVVDVDVDEGDADEDVLEAVDDELEGKDDERSGAEARVDRVLGDVVTEVAVVETSSIVKRKPFLWYKKQINKTRTKTRILSLGAHLGDEDSAG